MMNPIVTVVKTIPCLALALLLCACAGSPRHGGYTPHLDDIIMDVAPLETSYYHYSLGVLFTLNQKYEQAIEEYKKALTVDEHSPFLMAELATIYVRKGDLTSAAEILEKSLIYHPDYKDTHLLLGGIYGKLKEYNNAIKEYHTIISLDPAIVEPYILLSFLYGEQKKYDQAISTLMQLLKQDPENHMGTYYLAKIYGEMQRYHEAIEWMKKTVALHPDFESATVELGLLYQMEDNHTQAIELYRNYITRNPENTDIRQRLGKLLLKHERYREAAQEFEDILKIDGSLKDARFSLGLSYLLGNIDLDRALRLFRDILHQHPQDERAIYFIASTCEAKGLSTEALDEFAKIPPSSNFFVPARIHMGLIMKQRGSTDEAIEIISNAIETKKDDPELYNILASLQEDERQYERAVGTLAKGVKAIPGSIELRYSLGVLYEKMGRFDEGISMMKEIIELDPDNAEALNFIGYSYADRGVNLEEAETLLIKAVELKPGNGYITDSLGWLYFRQNKIAKAITLLEKAASLLPDDPTIAEHLGDAYAKGGYIKKALALYKTILKENPENILIKKKIEALIKTAP